MGQHRRQIWRTFGIVIAAVHLTACSDDPLPLVDHTDAPVVTVTSEPAGEGMSLEEGDQLQEALNTTDVGVTITTLAESANPGDTLVYSVTLSNYGPNPASHLKLTWVLSPNLDYLEDDAGCQVRGEELECHFGELQARDSVDVQLTVRVRDSAPLSEALVTTATIENEAGPDSEPSNNATQIAINVAAGTGDS